jgi:protoheme IX farnesyltransferase
MKTSLPPVTSEFARTVEPAWAVLASPPPPSLAPAFGVRQSCGALDSTAALAEPAQELQPENRPSRAPGIEWWPSATTSDLAIRISDFLRVWADLFKARLTLLVLLTTLLGLYLGVRGPANYSLMLHTLLGTALLASGASALNQLWERDFDSKMRRTRNRPLPSGRLQPHTVLLVGSCLAALGVVYLALAANPLTAFLGACSFLLYVFVYTPLKRVTWLNTLVGAIPGALPPLIGWAAARGALGAGGLSLFAIQALWQLPHFFAIAWIYRDEYANAGFRMLPVIDPAGRRTARQALGYTLILLPISLCPFLLSVAGSIYLSGALILDAAFIWCAWQFARHLTIPRARQLFYLSLLYLPLVFTLMALDKIRP